MLATATQDVVQAAAEAPFVHYAGVGGRQLDGGPGASLLRAARDAGAVITCDLISPRRSAMGALARLLPFVEYFMPSAAEALVLTGSSDLDAAADAFLSLGARACIIKDGARGSYVVLSESC